MRWSEDGTAVLHRCCSDVGDISPTSKRRNPAAPDAAFKTKWGNYISSFQLGIKQKNTRSTGWHLWSLKEEMNTSDSFGTKIGFGTVYRCPCSVIMLCLIGVYTDTDLSIYFRCIFSPSMFSLILPLIKAISAGHRSVTSPAD